MRIDRNSTICGMPSFEARALLRKLKQQHSFTVNDIDELTDGGHISSSELLANLLGEGYIESDEQEKECYRVAKKGMSLAMATAAKQIKRKTAEKLLEGFLDRVNLVNDADDYLHKVTKVIIFGSYLSDRPYIGDIDIAIQLERKVNNSDEFMRLQEQLIATDGAEDQTIDTMSRLFYSERKTTRFLVNKSRSISLHSTDDGILDTANHMVLYEEKDTDAD